MVNQVENVETRVVQLLRQRKQHVAIIEATTGGMISSAMLSVPSSSRVFHSGVVVYSGPAMAQYLPHSVIDASEAFRTEHNYRNEENYVASKLVFVEQVAKGMWKEFNQKRAQREYSKVKYSSGRCDWVLVESGTCGPEFRVPGVKQAFTAVGIAYPGSDDSKEPLIKTFLLTLEPSAMDRASNMSQFSEFALQCLENMLQSQSSKL